MQLVKVNVIQLFRRQYGNNDKNVICSNIDINSNNDYSF